MFFIYFYDFFFLKGRTHFFKHPFLYLRYFFICKKKTMSKQPLRLKYRTRFSLLYLMKYD